MDGIIFWSLALGAIIAARMLATSTLSKAGAPEVETPEEKKDKLEASQDPLQQWAGVANRSQSYVGVEGVAYPVGPDVARRIDRYLAEGMDIRATPLVPGQAEYPGAIVAVGAGIVFYVQPAIPSPREPSLQYDDHVKLWKATNIIETLKRGGHDFSGYEDFFKDY